MSPMQTAQTSFFERVPPSLSRLAIPIGRLAALVGVIGVGLMLWRAGPFEVWHSAVGMGPLVILVILAPAGGLWLHSQGWRLLLPNGVRPGRGRSFALYLASQAGDELGFGLLGEPIKVLTFPVPARSKASDAMLADNAAQLLALGICLGTLACWALPQTDGSLGLQILLCSLGVLAGGLLLLGIVSLRRAFARQFGVRSFLASVFLHTLGKAWLLPELALALALVGELSPEAVLWLALANLAGSVVGAPVPAQAGVLEGSALLVAGPAGLSLPAVLAVLLVRRLRGAAWVTAGLVVAERIIHANGRA